MSPKAIITLSNKNGPRTAYEPGSMLNARDGAGDKEARPCS